MSFRLLLAVVFALALAPAALAAPAQTLVVSPSPAYVGDPINYAGCGYGANKDVAVVTVDEATESILYMSFSTRTGSGGCFDLTPSQAPLPPGDFEVYTAYKTGSGVGIYGHHKWLAEVELEVLSAPEVTTFSSLSGDIEMGNDPGGGGGWPVCNGSTVGMWYTPQAPYWYHCEWRWYIGYAWFPYF